MDLRSTLPITHHRDKAKLDITEMEKIKPADSKVVARVPLSDSTYPVRLKYRDSANTVRVGRLLEDFDSMAVATSYKHNEQLKNENGRIPLQIVTACVDDIRFNESFHKHSASDDLFVKGQVAWVGRSSMDCFCSIENRDGDVLVESRFIMVARCPATDRAAPVIQLKPQSENEKKRFEQGDKLNKQRKIAARIDLFKETPTAEEMATVHDLYRTTLDMKTYSFASRTVPDGALWMEDLKLKNVLVCNPESRNIHNKIFGGWLMRQAVELAWSTACLLSKGKHKIVFIDDILFKEPVEIGSVLLCSSQIVYSEGNRFQVRVYMEKRTPETIGERGVTTNVIYLTFETENDVPRIYPRSYGEAMLLVDGKRHFDNSI